jgi:hypothetical protein
LHRAGAKIDLWILKRRIKSLIDSNKRFGRDVIKRNTTLMALSLMIPLSRPTHKHSWSSAEKKTLHHRSAHTRHRAFCTFDQRPKSIKRR